MPSPRPDLDALLQHADWVHTLARRLCADAHAADDAAQETWTAALKSPPSHGRNLRGWLGRLLRHATGMRARSERRRLARESAVARADRAEAAADTVARAELHRQLVTLVLELGEPQRALVLRHYFEGEAVAALAASSGLTADAVRAHLRRARGVLRARLEHTEGQARHGYALLLAATAGKGLLVPGAIMALTMQAKVALATAATAAAAILFWQLAAPSTAPEAQVDPTGAIAPATAAAPAVAVHTPTREPANRTEVPVAVAPRRVACRLVGLHPDATWTARVRIECDDTATPSAHHDALQSLPAADGTFEVVLPAWAATGGPFALRLRAEDPLYLDVDVRADAAALAADVCEIPVQVAALCTGQVVDRAGAPVPAARVSAFALRLGIPVDAVLAHTNTAADGSFTLRAPVRAAVLLVAVAMHELQLSGLRLTKQGGAIADDGRDRDDLLPAACSVDAVPGQRTACRALVLDAPAYVEGAVLRPGREPFPPTVAAPSVQLRYTGDARLHPTEASAALVFWRDGGIAREAGSGERGGAFRLPGVAGRLAHLVLDRQPEYPTLAPIDREVVPPCRVDLELPGRQLHVLVRIDGAPARGVSLLHGSKQDRGLQPTDRNGEARFYVPPGTDYVVQTMAKGCPPQERTFAAADAWPDPVVFDLQRLATVPVTVELVTTVPVQQAHFHWQPIDGTAGRYFVVSAQRGEHGQFRIEVPPGRYRLTIEAPEHGARRDTFLRTAVQDVDVPAAGAALRLAAAHGGRIQVDVRDAQGLRPAGSVRFVDAGGAVVVPGIRGTSLDQEAAGKLLATGPSECFENLAPGDYEVVLDLGALGIEKRRVAVRSGEVTEVKVELR